MPAARAVDAQKAFPEIAAAKVRIELALDEGRQRPTVGITNPPHTRPMLGHTAMEKGLIERARLVGSSAEHSIIFVIFPLFCYHKKTI
jgi:hypothetical protein